MPFVMLSLYPVSVLVLTSFPYTVSQNCSGHLLSSYLLQCCTRANDDRLSLLRSSSSQIILNDPNTSSTAMNSHLSFLDLPLSVRHRIPVHCPRIEYPQDSNPWPCFTRILPYKCTYRLLLTCRTIYSEVSPILYSENHFFIRYRDRRNLAELRNLTPLSVASLRHLIIHLSSCEQGITCCRSIKEMRNRMYGVDCHIYHDPPLDLLHGQSTIPEWIDAIS